MKPNTYRISAKGPTSADRVHQGNRSLDVSGNLRSPKMIAFMLVAAIGLISILAMYWLLARL